jgi:hypothetical protein
MPPEIEALVQSWNLPQDTTARVHLGYLELDYRDEAGALRVRADFPLERLKNGTCAPSLDLQLETFRKSVATAKGE